MEALRTQYGDLRDSLAIPSDTNWGWEWELGLDKGGYPGLGKGDWFIGIVIQIFNYFKSKF